MRKQVVARIHRQGPIAFADVMEAALHDEHEGFFARGHGAGRAGGDFVTSPEVGSLFGALVARALDAVWSRLGEPDPFVVVEAGAGRGRLAADVLSARPRCAPALRYVLVERSARLRAEQRDLLDLEPDDEALGPFTQVAHPDGPSEPVPGVGPIVSSLEDLPGFAVTGVVVANELLDNLPVRLVERSDAGWSEVRVGVDGDRLVEVLVPASPDLEHDAALVAAGAEVIVGARLPVPVGIREWLDRVSLVLERGEVILVDYMDDARGLLARGQSSWLRTYRGHARGRSALERLGTQDITVDVPLEHLSGSALRAGFEVLEITTQAAWLRALGIDDLVEEGRAVWHARAAVGDLEALAARSRVSEAAALTDGSGLGAHRVVVLGRARGMAG